jgi:hypothetical protein
VLLRNCSERWKSEKYRSRSEGDACHIWSSLLHCAARAGKRQVANTR